MSHLRIVLLFTLLFIGVAILPISADVEDYIFIHGQGLMGSSNGMAFGPDGSLYVANVWGNRITVLNPQTSEILRVIGAESGVDWPDDLVVAEDGTIYVTQEGPTGGVLRINPDGTSVRIAELPFSNSIAFSEDGRLFAAQCFAPENGLYEIDASGATEPRPVFGGIAGCALNAFDFGPDGFLYGPSIYEGKILRVNVDTGEQSLAVEGLTFPAAVEFDSRGLMHIADQATGEIYRYNLETDTLESFVQLEIGLDNLVFDTQDNLYASSATDGFIIEVQPDATSRIVHDAGMVAPAALDAQGSFLFVAEPQAIRQFTRARGDEYAIERSIFTVSEIGSPITIDVQGTDVLLSSWLNNSVRLWNRDSNELLLTMDFAVPTNAIFFGDYAVVNELVTGQVLLVNLDNPSERETLATLTVPLGLATVDNDLWVSDWATGMVWQLIDNGQTLVEPLLVTSGLKAPEGLAASPYGTLIIAETGTGKLLELVPATGEIYVLAEGLAYDPVPASPPDWFDGVTVAYDATIYASGRSANLVYRFEPERIPITDINELVGAWRFSFLNDNYVAQYNADGTYSVGLINEEPIDRGTFAVENGQLHYLSSEYAPSCGDARYNIFLLVRAGRTIAFESEPVGRDCFTERSISSQQINFVYEQ